MRLRALVPLLSVLAAVSMAPIASADPVTPPTPSVTAPPVESVTPEAPQPAHRPHITRPFHRSVSDFDSRVLASLLAITSPSDFDLTVHAGEVTCNGRVCTVLLTVKLPESMPPMRLGFAVANSKGELSDVKHAECLTAECSVQLVVERGRNTISVGASDGLSQTAGFAATSVNAIPKLQARSGGKAEWF